MTHGYSVYKHTTPSGKIYIGLTSLPPKERWDSGHGYKGNVYFTNAIKKYGWNNIKHEIIQDNLTPDEASKLEYELILKYDSTNPAKGYNLREGGTLGFHFKHNEVAKRKIAEISNRYWSSQNARLRMSKQMSGENNPFYGKHHTEESRQKMRDWHKEHPLLDEEITVRLKRLNWKGKTRSKESVEKSAKAKWKAVAQYSNSGEFIKIWNSAKEACETLNIHKSTLCQCCKGVKPSAGGYVWRYVKDD